MSASTDWYRAQQDGIEACCRQLAAEGVVEPLSEDEEETRSWMAWELASLFEGNCHGQLDVAVLSDEVRLTIERLVSFDGRPLVSPHGHYRLPFWLLDDGRRVGTIAISTMYSGIDLISVSSLYVAPAERKRSIARRALEAVYRATLANGAGGMRLDTSWTWQPAVRFYARIGMWIYMWKRNLVFLWQPDLPPYRVEIGESEARFLIEKDGEWRSVVTARNLGERLGWDAAALEPLQPSETFYCVPGTFALHLALAGWPLIRSDETWADRRHWSDAGQPEGLAYKIEIWEATFRERFQIRTPRIPGLQYRAYEDID